MKHLVLISMTAAALSWVAPVAEAGVISRACMQSNRTAATPALCGCIQQVANATLTRTERKKASKFFSDPHMAQEVRQSDRSRDEVFWKRYRAFGERARMTCS